MSDYSIYRYMQSAVYYICIFLPEDSLIGTETCWKIKASCVYFDGRLYEWNMKSF
jgi:hypothetical protein